MLPDTMSRPDAPRSSEHAAAMVVAHAGTMAGALRWLPRSVVRHRGWIGAAWLVVAAVLVPGAAHIGDRLDVAATVDGSESELVSHDLATRFGSPFARSVILVVTDIPSPLEARGRDALRSIVDSLKHAPGVVRTLSFLDNPDTLFLGAGGKGTLVVVGLDATTSRPDTLMAALRQRAARIVEELRPRVGAITLRWTGETALNADLRGVSAADVRGAELRALPITLLLLVLAFGAIVAATLPLMSALLAIGLALGAAALLARVMSLSVLLQNVVTMLGLGLGTDYALLVVSRYREARGAGAGGAEAAEIAALHTTPTIALSGLAVAIGFLALLAIPLNELRSVAVGALLVVAASVLFATTALPGLLALLAQGVDLGRVGSPRRGSAELWRRWGRLVTAHPLLVLATFGAPVGVLALQSARLRVELPRGNWLPPGMESALALEDLRAMRRVGVVQELRVELELPPSAPALSEAGWSATRRLAATLARDPAAASVRSLPALTEAGAGAALLPHAALLGFIPDYVRHSFVSRDGRAALVEVVPREGIEHAELTRYVERLRKLDAEAATGLPGALLRVGGLPAFNADYESAVAGRFFGIVAAIIGGTLLALAIGFRSVLVPLKAVALNLVSVAAAFGAVVVVFQDGRGVSLLGLPGAVDGTFPAIPILVFCTVFGLSMDYEVFLVARVAEARRSGHGERGAIVEGLCRTGGIITSAAAIMIAVFGSFTLGGFLLIKMLGFALAVTVLLDATVMRIAIGPALLALAGRWNWWPGA